jgi:hypothetical protein
MSKKKTTDTTEDATVTIKPEDLFRLVGILRAVYERVESVAESCDGGADVVTDLSIPDTQVTRATDLALGLHAHHGALYGCAKSIELVCQSIVALVGNESPF